MDKLLALRAFVEVAETGGFSSAARRLDLVTSSVTRSVDSLEKELGTVLLNRTTRQVTLSDAGTTYYAKAKKLLEDMADADASVSDRSGEASGPLRVSVPVAFGARKIAPSLAALLRKYPKLDLDIRLSDSLVDLVTDRIDVAIRLGEVAPTADVVSRRIGVFARFLVASGEYLERAGYPDSPAALTDHECLRFTYAAEAQVWTFIRQQEETRVMVTGRLKANSSEVLREAAIDGTGIALLPDWLVAADVQAGTLTRLLPDFDIAPNNARSVVSAVYLPNQRGSRRVNAFIDFISELTNGTA
ncbi:LysR family transcriptional regulator [Paraburkholderia ginsengiterrae]|uniref:LysR family transcriptional regulator n=1 Tax=Paraburkholderia ginsengiterrae TaxID=1462993 RepID=A0A1A9N7E0_9BURK|nr:LysR family transcriptional regulator [Paraburkholderia ginsengiterrae]OAJ54855.1 LysR family transcriptional regulator [Paraburkholderia ginsengiterrae]OAJ61042.1 LysR family transcriptional regulator [Paraburkholderia ginsengiterrae]